MRNINLVKDYALQYFSFKTYFQVQNLLLNIAAFNSNAFLFIARLFISLSPLFDTKLVHLSNVN